LVPEDPGIAVLIGCDRACQTEVRKRPRQNRHRVLASRVLGVRLDPVEVGLGARARDLELGDKDQCVAAHALCEDDRALVRQEPEPREVLDVRGVEEHVAGRAELADLIKQPSATLL
jgi:hypothetical protein